MAGKQQGGGLPGFDFGGSAEGFDFSALQNVLNDPGIKAMAEQLAQDPAFARMTQSLQSGVAPGAEASPTGPPIDPEHAAAAMSGMFSNPQFMQMAQDLGQKIMQQDPGMQEMMNTMNQPNFQEQMTERLNSMRGDPEIDKIVRDVEERGPSAMMSYWSDPVVLEKMSKVMGDVFQPEAGTAAIRGENGAEADEADEEEQEEEVDMPPLHTFASDGEYEKLKATLEDGADVDEKDVEGRTALQFSCGFGYLDCAEVLLQHNAAVDAVDNNKNTALHYAAGYGQKDIVSLLLKHNADKTKKNADDKTPQDVAEINEKTELFDLLK